MAIVADKARPGSIVDPSYPRRGFTQGEGSPEGVISASPGSSYYDTTDPSGLGFYTKISGTGRTGWQRLSSSRILGKSSAPVSHTGDTNETTLATIAIPAGAMGLSGILRISNLWTITNSGNNKTLRARLGGIAGTAFMTNVQTANLSVAIQELLIANRGAANSQVSRVGNSAAGGVSTSATITGTIDTSVAQTLVLTAQLASVGETITLESYIVELIV